ncbi:hypothetical protein GGD56_000856 [Rhizobium mongolense]|uniref:Uncharacterized protein n=1 Tax=Rhizobium mongolense TaxID=57676 RepID=A0ABR6IGP3_9HYPH|nr:hypothetical protein [Rhizobium mongolense]
MTSSEVMVIAIFSPLYLGPNMVAPRKNSIFSTEKFHFP